MKKKSSSDAVLGIFVNSNKVEAALLRPSGKQYHVVSRFIRRRVSASDLARAGQLTTALPGLKSSDEADFTIQVGEGSSAGDSYEMFLSNEFAGLGAQTMETKAARALQQRPAPFVKALRDILAECRTLGYENPTLAFCAGAPDVSYVEIFAAKDHIEIAGKKWSIPRKGDVDGGHGEADRRRLLELLAAQHKSGYDAARVAFVPMTPLQGQQRYLAIMPEPGDSITATLETLRGPQRPHPPASRLFGTEASLYVALTRKALTPSELENTAIVRIGSEDTLILFMTGTQLRHVERSRLLTSYDPLETICSRVLLQQDEQKIGEVHQVLILSEGRSEQHLDTFEKFYPNATVDTLQNALFRRGVEQTSADAGLPPNSVPAIGIGLNLLEAWWEDDPFGAVNLLPKKLRQKSRQQLAVAWHTIAMLVVLFGITLFFTWRYVQREGEIAQKHAELQLFHASNPITESPEIARARVDSLKRVDQQYTRALQVLDSLLVGSDQWSRMLEKTSRATRDLSGIWFESIQPTGLALRIHGNARARERVAHLANRLDGAIHETAFADINDVRIYPFTMIVPRPTGMPMVVDFLKETAQVNVVPSAEVARISSASNVQKTSITTPSAQQN